MTDRKSDLVDRLQVLRESVLWKLDGLSEYDLRRPMTPTGTNLLGLVKHLATCEFGYFGITFGRPYPIEMPWTAPGGEAGADMWATPDESTEYVVDGLYRRSWTFAAVDGAAGMTPGAANLEITGTAAQRAHFERVHAAADTFR